MNPAQALHNALFLPLSANKLNKISTAIFLATYVIVSIIAVYELVLMPFRGYQSYDWLIISLYIVPGLYFAGFSMSVFPDIKEDLRETASSLHDIELVMNYGGNRHELAARFMDMEFYASEVLTGFGLVLLFTLFFPLLCLLRLINVIFD